MALQIRELHVAIDTAAGPVPVVDDLSLHVPAGKTVALVGESGCGKSMTALAALRLLKPPCRIVSGQILLAGKGASPVQDLLQLAEPAMRHIRGNRVAIIFQDAMTALNPVYTVGEQIVEAVLLHHRVSKREAASRALALLERTALSNPRRVFREYPHRLSGGMRQRAIIAMALACGPDVLIADEPTTALDVTTQREILELLQSLQRAQGMGILLITHDLGVVADAAAYLYVMYAGRVVEHGPTTDLLASPLHPYTQGLLDCTPRLGRHQERLRTIPGSVPGPADWPSGCRFHPRCERSMEWARSRGANAPEVVTLGQMRVLRRCVDNCSVPRLRELTPGRFVACTEAAPEAAPP